LKVQDIILVAIYCGKPYQAVVVAVVVAVVEADMVEVEERGNILIL
jgi:hypothetical protein